MSCWPADRDQSEELFSGAREGGSQVNCCRRLPYAAFLVCDGDNHFLQPGLSKRLHPNAAYDPCQARASERAIADRVSSLLEKYLFMLAAGLFRYCRSRARSYVTGRIESTS